MGTLNLCFREPEKMQKTRDKSDSPRLRKLPKTAPKLQNFNLADFLQFFNVFSVWDDRIDFYGFTNFNGGRGWLKPTSRELKFCLVSNTGLQKDRYRST